MDELLQSAHTQGQHPEPHPDADQLTAFIEHALPAHERAEVLAHLAVCTDCREIVVLSMPPADAPPVVETQPVGKSWFSSWSVFLPAAVALAGLGIFIVYINRAPRLNQTAQNQTPAAQMPAPQPAAQPPPIPESKTPLEDRRESGRRGPGAIEGLQAKPGASAASSNSPTFGRQQIRIYSALSPALKDKAADQDEVQGAFQGSASGGSMGAGARQAVASPAPAVNKNTPMAPSQSASAARFNSPLAPASTAIAPPPPSSETVNVSGASQALSLQTTSANIDNTIVVSSEAQAVTLKRALPSRLEALSVATHGRQVLAIDSRNAVFVSDDSGRHWKSVQASWQGKAVRASFATPIAADEPLVISGRNFAGLAGNAPAEAKAMNASITGEVTDRSGAIIPNATVVISNLAGQQARTLRTDAQGRYVVGDLAPGSYNIEARAPGFEMRRVSGVAVGAWETATVNLSLNVGAAAETVTVEAAPVSDATLSSVQASRKRSAVAAAPAVFEITTDAGDRWTSADGLTWQRK